MDGSLSTAGNGGRGYERTVDLGAGSLAECRTVGTRVAENIRALADRHFPRLKGYEVELAASPAGGLAGTIRRPRFEASIETAFGQNRQYGTGGQLRSGFTFSFSGAAEVSPAGATAAEPERVAMWTAAAGAGGMTALCVYLVQFLDLSTRHSRSVAKLVVSAIVIGGGVLGCFLGLVLGRFVARAVADRAARDETLTAACRDWQAFLTDVKRLLAEAGGRARQASAEER